MPNVTPLHADDPSRVGRYRLSGRIAGMPAAGPVYLARTVDGSGVTITLVGGDWTGEGAGAARDRFTAEANAARRVAPFCAARILDAGFDADQPYLVSEFVEGPSLREFVTEEGPWEGDDLEALAIGMATGLAAIHQAGLVHGEFGPDRRARGGRTAGRPVQHHPALWHRHPRRGPAGLGLHGPVRGGRGARGPRRPGDAARATAHARHRVHVDRAW